MTQPAYILGLGGAFGAVLRFAIGQLLSDDRFPVSTLVVNAVGSFLLGLAVFGGLNGDLFIFFAVGLCGSFTTYSSFSVDAIALWDSNPKKAVVYVVMMTLLCLAAAGLAAGVVRLVSP